MGLNHASGPPGNGDQPRVALLFTTFPVVSETFLQREVRELARLPVPPVLVSLWKGAPDWEDRPVRRFGVAGLAGGLLRLPLWFLRQPGASARLIRMVWRPRRSGLLNWMENVLGVLYGFSRAGSLQASGITHLHGVWASAPAMAALAVHRLTGIPWSFAGHAYDLFERGGDGWLPEKAAQAGFIRTSTEAGRRRMGELGIPEEKILLIRRGLEKLPPFLPEWPPAGPWRLLSVGRMVEKMGFERQIPVISSLVRRYPDLRVEWIGDGPLRPRLERVVQRAGLQGVIHFRGRQPYEVVEEAYRSHHLFLFTGRIDRNGDRAGLPNAVAEAMAWGLVVFATDVGAVGEAVEDGVTGHLWTREPDAEALVSAMQSPEQTRMVRARAREWIEAHFLLQSNLSPLSRCLSGVTFSP